MKARTLREIVQGASGRERTLLFGMARNAVDRAIGDDESFTILTDILVAAGAVVLEIEVEEREHLAAQVDAIFPGADDVLSSTDDEFEEGSDGR